MRNSDSTTAAAPSATTTETCERTFVCKATVRHKARQQSTPPTKPEPGSPKGQTGKYRAV